MAMNNNRPSFVWPQLLELPPDDILLVYLDLNHWIGLAKASAGHPQGRDFLGALDACRVARSQGKTAFVLSGAIYAEMLKIKDPAQRLALAQVMNSATVFTSFSLGELVKSAFGTLPITASGMNCAGSNGSLA